MKLTSSTSTALFTFAAAIVAAPAAKAAAMCGRDSEPDRLGFCSRASAQS